MRHFDNELYTLYSKTFNKKDKLKADEKLDKDFKIALNELIRECIKFTKIVEHEKNKDIDFESYLHF